MKVVLELLDQPSNIRKITVRHDIVIGRGADCNLRLSAPQISRRHCFLRISGASVSVTDLDSSNGTFVDGRRIESGKRHEVQDGVTLGLGPIRFELAVRTEKVNPDVLSPRALDDSIKIASHSMPGSRSTMIEVDSQPIQSPEGLNYSVEHGGPSAEDNEPTADLADDIIDSASEIVDLGKRIHEFELNQRMLSSHEPETEQQFNTERESPEVLDLPDDAALLD